MTVKQYLLTLSVNKNYQGEKYLFSSLNQMANVVCFF
jgi:hypothetical protein